VLRRPVELTERKADLPGDAPQRPNLAEAVEKVGAARIFDGIVHDSGLLRNFDSMAGFALNHCFKKFLTGDFFNRLSHEPKSTL
jgi:hypothetical protein